MSDIIRGGAVVADPWRVLRAGEGEAAATLEVPEQGAVVVPLATWLAQAGALVQRGNVAVWLAGDDDPAALAPWFERLSLVAVDFPKFTDGRGYSIAYLLRARFHYRGELRAIGDVLPDQLLAMRRTGFDSFALRADRKAEHALAALEAFSDAYPGTWQQPLPAFRRHARDWPESEGQPVRKVRQHA